MPHGVSADDLFEIHHLLGRYGHAIDRQRWDEFAAMFTDDAVLDYTRAGAPQVFAGREAIVDWFRGVTHPSAHHVSNIVVSVEGADRATVESKFFVPYTRPVKRPLRIGGGDYLDVVVRTEQGWQFASKVCVKHWQLTPDDDELDARLASF